MHAGNIGFKQDLGNLVAAARLAHHEASPLRFVVMGDGAERVRVKALAADLPNVEFLAPQPTAIFMDVLASADVLIINERPTVLDMSLPSKITSYFRAGRPVVAAVPPAGATAAELRRSGGAVLVPAGDPQALLSAIRMVLRDTDLSGRITSGARAYACSNLDMTVLLERSERFIADMLRGSKS